MKMNTQDLISDKALLQNNIEYLIHEFRAKYEGLNVRIETVTREIAISTQPDGVITTNEINLEVYL